MSAKARQNGFGPLLVVMVKAPVMGRVKTRLARDLGPVMATRFFRANLALTLRRLGRDPRWRTLLAVTPDAACSSRFFELGLARVPQGRGDLGQRMQRVAETLPPGPLVIIGADIPAIRTTDIAAALRALKGSEAAFGPARDGGYWLIALSSRTRRRRQFDNVRWSTAHALADTRANLAGRRSAEIANKDDVDTGDDLARLDASVGRLIISA